MCKIVIRKLEEDHSLESSVKLELVKTDAISEGMN